MLVSISDFEAYLKEYFTFTTRYLAILDGNIKQEIIPKCLLQPYKIKGTISLRHGVSIEFIQPTSEYRFEVMMVPNPIVEAMLPQRDSRHPMFYIGAGRFSSFTGLFFASEEFAEKNIYSNVSCFTYKAPLDGFLDITTGDIAFYLCKFGAILRGKQRITEIRDGLWIRGKNEAEDYTVDKARIDAKAYIDVAIARLIHPNFNVGNLDQTTQTIERYNKKIFDFKKLIEKEETHEPDLQKFFEENPNFLYLGTRYKRIIPHPILKRKGKPDLIPDFLLERVNDGYCDILDIKLPEKKLVVGLEDRKRFSSNVDEAIAQVSEYREYFEETDNRRTIENDHGVKILKPNVLVLIGDSSNVDIEHLIKIKDRRKDGEVIAYNDIITQMTALIELIRG
jgi:hypothetical protein